MEFLKKKIVIFFFWKLKCSYALSQWIEGIIVLLFPPNFVVLFLALFLGNIFRPVQNIKILRCPSFNLFFLDLKFPPGGNILLLMHRRGCSLDWRRWTYMKCCLLCIQNVILCFMRVYSLTKYIHTVKLVFQWLYLSTGLKLMLKWMQVLKFGYFTGLTAVEGCVFWKHSKPIVDCSSYIILLLLTMLLEITAQVVFRTGQWSWNVGCSLMWDGT